MYCWLHSDLDLGSVALVLTLLALLKFSVEIMCIFVYFVRM